MDFKITEHTAKALRKELAKYDDDTVIMIDDLQGCWGPQFQMRFAPVTNTHTRVKHEDFSFGLEESTLSTYKMLIIDSSRSLFGTRYIVFGTR